MKHPIRGQHLLAWLLMLLVMIANGSVRDLLYRPYMTELAAHQLSTAIGIVLLGALMWAFFRRYPPVFAHAALVIGLFWTGLTVAFEFLFFHFLLGVPWPTLLANYDLRAGRVWTLLLCWVALAPWLLFILRRKR